MKAVFIDESKSKRYLVCAVFVELGETPVLRRALYALRLKGQSRIHFVSESPSRRRKILTEFRRFPISVKIYSSNLGSDREDRKRCLTALVDGLNPEKHYQIWIELDANHLRQDQVVLTQQLQARGFKLNVDFHHEESRKLPLLWIPDAIVWTYNRGGNWTKELDGFQIDVIDL